MINWILTIIHYWIARLGEDGVYAKMLKRLFYCRVRKIRCDFTIKYEEGFSFNSQIRIINMDIDKNYDVPDFLFQLKNLRELRITGTKLDLPKPDSGLLFLNNTITGQLP